MTVGFPIPLNEAERQRALRRYEILDTASEQVFDDLTAVAAEICGVPIATLTLIAEDRQWFKSKIGLDGTGTAREFAFCAHAIMKPGILEIPDATRDERFAANPYVVDDPNIRFYAGSTLMDQDGFALGTLCVIDRIPRKLTEGQRFCLAALGRSATAAIEARLVARQLATANVSLAAEMEAHRVADRKKDLLLRALGSDESNLKAMRGLLPICSYCKGIRDESGAWHRLEAYLARNAEFEFSHGICPGCLTRERGTMGSRSR